MLGFGALIACALALALAPSPARASLVLLQPDPSVPATFVGNGGYSSDGLGQDTTGGTVQAEVPLGSTVEQAYLYGTYNSNTAPSEAQRTIDVDGTDVVLQTSPNSEPGDSDLSTARAEITSLVAAKVGAGGGITDFAINSDPDTLDGVALVVIFSNPALPETTIAVLDGGSKQAGDQATFNFAGPIDPTEPEFLATMALGIGFSFQGGEGDDCFLGQFSTVEVNSQLLTGCAGNFDDGLAQNDALITVGGVGDSLDNPTPPDNPPTDDELYNLKPFLTTGDTQLVIQTANPSEDDNLFLAIIATTAEARVTTEICDNGIDDDGDGLIDGADPDCQEPPGDEICDNGIDDDGDGLIDGADPDCQEPPPPGGKCRGEDVTIAGTEGPDAITGTPGPDVIDAKGGDDQISGLGGNDVICAGDGDDVAAGGAGNDLVLGQGGNDEIGGGGGVDRLAGGPGDDAVSGGLDNDRVNGGTGNDDVGGGPGADRVAGGAGNDDAGGGIGADQVTGGAGDDNVNGGNGNDDVGGGTGNDVIGGDAGNDRLAGGGGDDTMRGAEGDDRLGGGTGNDDLGGGPGNDDLAGGPGVDDLKGGQGNDDLHGGPGSDTCDGGTGDNTLTSCESEATRRR